MSEGEFPSTTIMSAALNLQANFKCTPLDCAIYGAQFLQLGRLPARLHSSEKAGQGALQDKRKSNSVRCRVASVIHKKCVAVGRVTDSDRIRLAHLASESRGQQEIRMYKGVGSEERLSIAHSSHN